MHIRISRGRKAFLIFNTVVSLLIAIACLAPMIHILALSLSGKNAVVSGSVGFWPVDITMDSYRYVMDDPQFFRAFGVSVLRTALALVIQMVMTILAAYPLSMRKQKFRARGFYVWLLMITMLFSGGLIPTYLVVSKAGLMNSIWALLLPAAVPVYHVILLQNFIKALPDEISEAAAIDGAGHFQTLLRVILPLCKASLATLCLFVAVNNWNAWFDGMIYIDDNTKFPLQTYLRTIIIDVNTAMMSDMRSLAQQVASTGADAAKILISMIPILMVYPFLQKYFVKGIVHGSLKE